MRSQVKPQKCNLVINNFAVYLDTEASLEKDGVNCNFGNEGCCGSGSDTAIEKFETNVRGKHNVSKCLLNQSFLYANKYVFSIFSGGNEMALLTI